MDVSLHTELWAAFISYKNRAVGMNIALFLGAGASVPYGKPTTKQFVDILSKESDGHRSFLSYYPSIERVLTAIHDNVEFDKTEGAKWWSMRSDIGAILQGLEKSVHSRIYNIYAWNHAYDENVAKIFSSIFGFVRERGSKITVFTTNYDRSVEEYCTQPERQHECIDGFSPEGGLYTWTGDFAGPRENDADRSVFLYKLHGSLDWGTHNWHGRIKTNVEGQCEFSPELGRDLIIYPTLSENNDGDEMFAEIFDAFSAKLKSQDACIVVGFSFQIEKIRKQFAKFAGAGKTLIVVDPEAHADLQKTILNASPDGGNNQPKQNIHHIRKELSVDTVDSILNQVRALI